MSMKPKQKIKFESPLNKWISKNCNQCDEYRANRCNLATENGIDRMFLCMSAKNCLDAAIDPEQILQDAAAVIGDLKNMGCFFEEKTPDEQSEAGTRHGRYPL